MESGSCDSPQFFQNFDYAQSFSREYAAACGCPQTGGVCVCVLLLVWLRPRALARAWSTISCAYVVEVPRALPNRFDVVHLTPSKELCACACVGRCVANLSARPEHSIAHGLHHPHWSRLRVPTGTVTQGVCESLIHRENLCVSVWPMKMLVIAMQQNLLVGGIIPALWPFMPWGPAIDGTRVGLLDDPLKLIVSGPSLS